MSFLTSERRVSLISALLAWLIFLGTAVWLQHAAGAYQAELIGYPDEPAHYVTGLAVRDYVAQGFPNSPVRYAENYYLHYPKFALGKWPPVFYVVQAAWMLVFSSSRASVIFLSAFLTSLIALTIHLVIRKEYGVSAGLLGGLLFTALPLVQQATSMVMSDTLVALLSFWAVLGFSRYLATARLSHGALFGFLAACAMLVKGNALCLVMVPPTVMLIQRRVDLLKRVSFYVAPLIVALLAGPWYAATTSRVVPDFPYDAGTRYTLSALSFYGHAVVRTVGIGLFLFVLLGVWARIVRPFRAGEVEGKWAAAFSLGLSCFLFHCVVSSGLEPRYLLSAVPVMVMFLVAGVAYAAALLPLAGLSTTHKMGVLAAALAMIFWVGVFRVPRKYSYGFQNVAEDLLARPEFKDSVILVSSEREGEGALVSELAMHEHPRPQHVILRGSKVLADSDWMGVSYKLRFNTEDEIERYLEQIPVGVLVLDISPPKYRYAHHEMLQKVIQAHPDRWKLVQAYERKPPDLPFPMKILVYSQEGHQNMAKGTIEIELESMSRTIRKSLAEPGSSR